MRFHLLSVPNVQTTGAYSLDGFCMATIKFARLLKGLGHHVTLYASEENEAPCDELVTVITKEEQETLLAGSPYQYAAFNEILPLWQLSNQRMIREIATRKQPRDFICSISGGSQKPVADAHPELMFVEYSIGYIGSFAKYRVYESNIWRHCTHGFQDDQQGRFFDETIPYFFDEIAFPYPRKKEPFALYVGRLTEKKGVGIACKAARLAGIPLKIIGHGDPGLVTDGAEYLGALADIERNEWLARASVFISPTRYLEPFGAMAVEAQMCGTPVVSTNFGAFVETVEQGKTGYRCNYMGEFVRGLQDAPKLDSKYIRERAVRLYSMTAAAPRYQRYFDRLMLLWGDGFETVETNMRSLEVVRERKAKVA
jgi:glycosyltransferase involved in cell wall biosynthesis